MDCRIHRLAEDVIASLVPIFFISVSVIVNGGSLQAKGHIFCLQGNAFLRTRFNFLEILVFIGCN